MQYYDIEVEITISLERCGEVKHNILPPDFQLTIPITFCQACYLQEFPSEQIAKFAVMEMLECLNNYKVLNNINLRDSQIRIISITRSEENNPKGFRLSM